MVHPETCISFWDSYIREMWKTPLKSAGCNVENSVEMVDKLR